MLPLPSSPDFPDALQQARQLAGMNRTQLARAAGIHPVMIGRYEDRHSAQYTQPNHNTWLALNRALGMQPPATANTKGDPASLPLADATIDQIVAHLKSRGIGVTLSFPI